MKYADFPKAVIRENVDYTVKEITNIIKRYGPRESGNENCYATQKHIKKEMDIFADETGFESYKIAPKAFLHFTKTVSLCIILAVVVCLALTFLNVFDGVGKNSFFLPQIIVGAATAIGLLITVFEFLFYKKFCDAFYKKTEGHNFYAKRKPVGEIKRRFVISGHCDAAYEWRNILYFKGAAGIAFALPAIFAVLSFIVALLSIIASYVNMGEFGVFLIDYGFYFHGLTVLAMVLLFFSIDFKSIVPGANDNLTGTYAAVCAMRMLDMAGVELENTELVCMITDGEEAGLRGSKAWIETHHDEYTDGEIETAVLCVDTLCDLDDFCVYNKDMTGLVRNSKEFSQFVSDCSAETGREALKLKTLPFGASDAAAFSQGGAVATALCAMDPKPADYYHNRRDNFDRLNRDAIQAGFEVVLSTILAYDENGLNKQ